MSEDTGQQPAPDATAAPAPETPAASPQQEPESSPQDSWEARYKGQQRAYQELQGVHTQALQDLSQQREAAAAAQTAAQAATGELATAQQVLAAQQQQIAALQQEGMQAMQEAAYWQMVQADYPDLLPFANSIQRAPTPEAQTQVLDAFREALGQVTTQTVQSNVAQTFAGVTPTGGGAPPAGAQTQPTYGEIMGNVMDAELQRRDPVTYNKWMELYRNSPTTGPSSLHGENWQDPFQNDYQIMQQRAGQQAAPLTQQHAVQNVAEGMQDANVFSNAPRIGADGRAHAPEPQRPPGTGGMPNAYGGNRPPTAKGG